MYRILVFVFLIVSFASAQAQVLVRSELHDWKWEQSTILAAVSAPKNLRGKNIPVPPPSGKKALRTSFWKAKGGSRGLYILIPGTGANATSGTSNLLGDRLSRNGWDVLILANPFSVDFQMTFSSDGVVGIPQRDILDAAEMVDAAYAVYARAYGKPRRVRLIGYSLGASYVGMLSQLQLSVPFSQYVMLNPPVDFGYAMDQLDAMIRGARLDKDFTLTSFLRTINPLFDIAAKGVDLAVLPILREQLVATEYQNKYVIGASFAYDLATITWNLRRTPFFSEYRDRQVNLEKKFYRMTFERYLGFALVAAGPDVKGATGASLIAGANLKALLRGGRNRDKMVLVTNQDDFLLRKKDFATLRGIGARRYYLFDGGGHCGNYWTESFGRVLSEVVRD